MLTKNLLLQNANFALEFLSKKGFKAPNKIYTSHLREELESYLASTAFTAFDITNHCHLIQSTWNSIFSPITAKIWKSNSALTSNKVLDLTQLPLYLAHLQIPSISLKSHFCLPKPCYLPVSIV